MRSGAIEASRRSRWVADTADLIHTPASDAAREAGAHRWIAADPSDVVNWANLVIHFEDGSR